MMAVARACVTFTLLALVARHRAPFVAVGWFWYLGTLVPVIGLLQVGGQALADRYTYVPLIGIFVVVAWGVPWAVDRRPAFGGRDVLRRPRTDRNRSPGRVASGQRDHQQLARRRPQYHGPVRGRPRSRLQHLRSAFPERGR